MLVACILGYSCETHSTFNNALGVVDDHTTSTKHMGTNEKSGVKDRKGKCDTNSINVDEIDVISQMALEKRLMVLWIQNFLTIKVTVTNLIFPPKT